MRATGDDAPLEPSDSDAPEPGEQAVTTHERRWSTSGPVEMTVARGAVGFGSGGGGHERRGSLRRSREAWSSPAMEACMVAPTSLMTNSSDPVASATASGDNLLQSFVYACGC
jgi:hypothetical protein